MPVEVWNYRTHDWVRAVEVVEVVGAGPVGVGIVCSA